METDNERVCFATARSSEVTILLYSKNMKNARHAHPWDWRLNVCVPMAYIHSARRSLGVLTILALVLLIPILFGAVLLNDCLCIVNINCIKHRQNL